MHFLDLELGKQPARFDKRTVKTAFDVLDVQSADAASALTRALPPTLPDSVRKGLGAALGVERHHQSVNASNVQTQRAFAHGFMLAGLGAFKAEPERLYQLLTFKPDDWLIDEFVPRVPLMQARIEAHRWMGEIGFEGLGRFELTPLREHPYPPGNGWALSWHLHLYGFVRAERSSKAGLRTLRKRGSCHCSVDKGIDRKSIKPTLSDHAAVLEYVTKPKVIAKNIIPNSEEDGSFYARDYEIPRRLRLRCAEIMSHIRFTELIVTRGRAGWAWRQAALKHCDEAVRSHRAPLFGTLPPKRLWPVVWRELSQASYYPVRVDRL